MWKKSRVYVGFINFEKAYDWVNRKVLWQVLRIYDVNRIKNMYIDNQNKKEQDSRDKGISCPLGFSMYICMQ